MKIRKMLIITLSFLLTVCLSFPSDADIVSSHKVTEVIDVQLQAILQEATLTEKIPVDIWLFETSTKQEREQQIYSKIGINKAQIVSTSKTTVSAQKIDAYITAERSLYAAEREAQYATFRLEYSSIDGLQETRINNTRLFYSQYAPMISAELTRSEIKLLARDSRVQSIHYSPDVTLVDEGDISLPLIGANYTRDMLGYNGSGIKIGMIEGQLPDIYSNYFTSDNIICEYEQGYIPPSNDNYPHHATTVAAIMVGKTVTVDGVAYKGIVPNAKLYATTFNKNVAGDWRARIEWLLSQGVHVINMSATVTDVAPDPEDTTLIEYDGTYTMADKWVDHIANNHHVHFVNSAGNSGTAVTAPGMAYNVLTVGAINDYNTLDPSDDARWTTDNYCSSYLESENCTNKPDLMAPGANIHTAAFSDSVLYPPSGTSYAAPHVTAVVAQLCQCIPSLSVMQPCVKAILTASISHSTHAYDCSINDADGYDQYGAGVVNAKSAFETVNAYRMMGGSFPKNCTADAEKVYTFSANAGQRVRVSLSWLKYSSNAGMHTNFYTVGFSLADLDLYIIDPDGIWINCSNSYYNNTEIVDFTTSKTGTYQMVVVNHSPSEENLEFGIAWWFE